MARTFELELFGEKADATGPAGRVLRLGRRRHGRRDRGSGPTPTTSPTGAQRATGDQLLQIRPVPPGARSASSPARYGAQVLGPLVARLDRPDVRVIPVDERRSSAAPRRSPGLLVGEDLARMLAAEPAGHRYLLPDVCLVERPLPRRRLAGRPAPPRRDHPHRRPRPPRRARRLDPRWKASAMTDCPPSPSSAAPTWASPRSMNRIVGKRVAIVEEKPGVTRDRKEVDAEWHGVPFRLVDTGGWMPGGDRPRRQGEPPERAGHPRRRRRAPGRSTPITGVTEEDARVAEVVRNTGPRQGARRGQQGRRRRPRGPDLGGACRSASATRSAVSALHGRGLG